MSLSSGTVMPRVATWPQARVPAPAQNAPAPPAQSQANPPSTSGRPGTAPVTSQDIQIAVDQAVAGSPALTSSTLQPIPPNVIPAGAVDIATTFFVMVAVIVIGWPLARAFARRMERKGQAPAIAPDVSARLERIEQAVDAIAIEVERISEGQRFTNRLIGERVPEEKSPVSR
jgi:hypothetical protein